MKKVFISGRIPNNAKELLSKHFEVISHEGEDLLSSQEIAEGAKEADALLCLLSDPITAEVMEGAKNLKIIETDPFSGHYSRKIRKFLL